MVRDALRFLHDDWIFNSNETRTNYHFRQFWAARTRVQGSCVAWGVTSLGCVNISPSATERVNFRRCARFIFLVFDKRGCLFVFVVHKNHFEKTAVSNKYIHMQPNNGPISPNDC